MDVAKVREASFPLKNLEALQVDSQDNVYLGLSEAGNVSGTPKVTRTIKYDADGAELWSRPGSGTADSAGNFFARDGNNLIRYDSAGNVIWNVSADVQGSDNSEIKLDGSGNIYIFVYSNVSSLPARIIKHAADGGQFWSLDLSEHLSSPYGAAEIDGAGSLYVVWPEPTETNVFGSVGYEFIVAKYNPDGTQAWRVRYDSPRGTGRPPVAIRPDGSGNVYVTGELIVGSFLEEVILKYDSQGNPIRTNVLQYGHSIDNNSNFQLDASGNLYLLENSSTGPAKLGPEGDEVWDIPPRYFPYSLISATLDGVGNVYAAGLSLNNLATFKYNANGSDLWSIQEDFPNPQRLAKTRIAVDSRDQVYLAAGYKYPDWTNDWAVLIKYRQDNRPELPRIVRQPRTQYVSYSGSGNFTALTNVTLTVEATGAAPLSYQWQSGSIPIPGATNPVLVVTNPAGSPSYAVLVSNAFGAKLSDEITIWVNSPTLFLFPIPALPVDTPPFRLSTSTVLPLSPITFTVLSGPATLSGDTVTLTGPGRVVIRASQPGDLRHAPGLAEQSFLVFSFAKPFGVIPQFIWTQGGFGDDRTTANGLALDPQGNLYVIGDFSGSASLGGVTVTSRGDTDVFLAKYSSRGSLLWIRTGGGSGSETAAAVAVDAAGNSYVTGSFERTASWGTLSLTVREPSLVNPFLAKYDPNGELLWLHSVEVAGSSRADGVALDAENNVYATGTRDDFGGFYLVQYDATGNLLRESLQGTPQAQTDTGRELRNPSGLVVTPEGEASIIGFHPDLRMTLFVTGPFLASFDTKLALQDFDFLTMAWLGFGGGAHANGLALDQAGNRFVTGYRLTPDDLLADNGGLPLGGFVAKYSSLGGRVWARPSGSIGQAVAVDPAGEVYVTGLLNGPVTLAGTELTPRPGESDIFIAKYDSKGNIQWAYQPGGVFSSSGNAIVLDDRGYGYVAGFFYGTLNWGTNRLTGDADMFVAKFGFPPSIISAPKSQKIAPGASVSFAVEANGAVPLAYQWHFNGIPINGATNPLFSISNVQASDAGDYTVTVSNEAGAVTTDVARLALPAVPAFSLGSLTWTGAALSVSLEGETGATYLIQWSSDLLTWTDLLTIASFDGAPIVLEPAAAPLTYRFYRVVLR